MQSFFWWRFLYQVLESFCLEHDKMKWTRMMPLPLTSHKTLLLASFWWGGGAFYVMFNLLFYAFWLVSFRIQEKNKTNGKSPLIGVHHQPLKFFLFICLAVLVTLLIKSAMTHQSVVISLLFPSLSSGKAPNSPSSPPCNSDSVSSVEMLHNFGKI